MANDFSIDLIGSLDEAKSKQQINKDIDNIKQQLNNIDLKATISDSELKSIESQLNTLKVQLSDVTISPSSLKDLVSQINNALQGIQISLNIGGSNNPSQAGSNFGRLFADSVNDAIKDVTSPEIDVEFGVSKASSNKFHKEVSSMISKLEHEKATAISYDLDTRTTPVTDDDGKPTGKSIEELVGGVFKYVTATGESIRKTVSFNNALGIWVESSARYSKSLDQTAGKVDNFSDKVKTSVSKANNELATIESNLKSSSKKINIDSNKTAVENQITNVNDAIQRLGNSTKDVFTDNVNAVNTEITALKNLIKECQNAEYAATSLRTKDLNTIKIDEQNNLDSFVEKMKQSGHYTSELSTKVTALKSQINNLSDTDELIAYLNEFSNLKSEFDKVNQTAKTSEKESLLNSKKSSEEKSLEVYKQSLSDAGILVGEVEGKVNGLFNSLKAVTTDAGLTNWKATFKGIKAELDAALKAATSSKNEFNLSINVDAARRQLEVYKKSLEDAGVYTGSIKEDIDNLFDALNGLSTKNGFDNWKVSFKGIKAEADAALKAAIKAGNEIKKLSSADLDKLKSSIFNIGEDGITRENPLNKYFTKIEEFKKNFSKIGFNEDEINAQINPVIEAYKNLKSVLSETDVDPVSSYTALELLKSKIDEVSNSYKQIRSDASKFYDLNKQSRLSNDIQNWLSKNTRASHEARSSLEGYLNTLNSGSRVSVQSLNSIAAAFRRIDAEQRGLGKLGKSLRDQLKQASEDFMQWFSVTTVIMSAKDAVVDSVKELKNLDDVLTEINKTSDLTKSQLKELGMSAYDSASKYGKTAGDYLTGVQEMYRAGFDNAAEMSELSILAQAAGDMTSDIANNYLIATDAAYGLNGSAEKLNQVLDGQNYITNNAAVSMNDMAEATGEAASISAQYGVQVDQLSSLIAVAASKTRETGSEVGNALKSIFVNLQDTTSKPIKKVFESIDVSMTKIVNGSETLKTPIELLKELSDVFVSLDEGSTLRANILSDIGGKYHANTLAAILSDWESYYEMLELYESGSGSAMREAQKSAENWSGSLNSAKNAVTELVDTIVNQDGIIKIINMFTNLVNKITDLVDKTGALVPLAAGIGTKILTSNGLDYSREYKWVLQGSDKSYCYS